MTTTELIKQLLEAGVHFGHQTKRWNPKMKRFIFGKKKGIYVIDLEKTQVALDEARTFLSEMAAQGKSILFVGTKKQAQDVIELQAKRCGVFYVNRRWLGGLLTNFQTIKKSIQRYKEIEQMEKDGIFESLSKKEIASLSKERSKLVRSLAGVIEMVALPAVIFIVDAKKEETAVLEANRLGIPVVALVDTNCDPDRIAYPIPGNDDAIKSVAFITSVIAESIMEGRKRFKEVKSVIAAVEDKEKAQTQTKGQDVPPVVKEQQPEQQKSGGQEANGPRKEKAS